MLKVKRGDVIYVNLGQNKGGSVTTGMRPCLVISNNKSSWFSRTLCVCPFTTKIKVNPVHVKVEKDDVIGYLEKDSEILPEQVVTIDKRDVMSQVGHIPKESEVMKAINYAVCLQFGLLECLQEVMEYAAEKNR
jgi:mRNA interferase MazF